MIDLPALPGAYVLELYLPWGASLTVGQLGRAHFPAGVMFYLGSARGPGGLKGRLARHLQPDRAITPHWHIDYLRRIAWVRAIAYLFQQELPSAGPLECMWSQALVGLSGSHVPLPGFGASDCRLGCPAHLFAFPGERLDSSPLLNRPAWLQALEQAVSASLTIRPALARTQQSSGG
jgi:Uri superfamily endonuclease